MLSRCHAAALLALLPLAACTGLVAGPASTSSIVVPAASDSVWNRGRRALAADFFTIEYADSVHGRIYGVRHPKAGVMAQDPYACRVHVKWSLLPAGDSTAVEAITQWTAPQNTGGKPSVACDTEVADVMDRMNATLRTGR